MFEKEKEFSTIIDSTVSMITPWNFLSNFILLFSISGAVNRQRRPKKYTTIANIIISKTSPAIISIKRLLGLKIEKTKNETDKKGQYENRKRSRFIVRLPNKRLVIIESETALSSINGEKITRSL
jgi:hypothetical protein